MKYLAVLVLALAFSTASAQESIMTQKDEKPEFVLEDSNQYKFHKHLKSAGSDLQLTGIMYGLAILGPGVGLILYSQGDETILPYAAVFGGIAFVAGSVSLVSAGSSFATAAKYAPMPREE